MDLRQLGRSGALLIALVLTALIALTAPVTPGAPSSAPSAAAARCAYLERNPPGPRGNVLRIVGFEGTFIEVQGNEIKVDRPCDGETPTVHNLDRITYTTSRPGATFISGPLAPGATPERGGGSEIELVLRGPLVNNIRTTSDEGETLTAGRLGRRKVGVNLNSNLDGDAQDADVIISSGGDLIRLRGGDGPDRILNRRGSPFVRAFTGPSEFVGDQGDDFLLGGPGRQKLGGGPGDDRLLGGRGRDRIRVGDGADLARGGSAPDVIVNGASPTHDTGPDQIFGGTGNDSINVVNGNSLTDMIDCGPGRDRAIVDRSDRTRRCERVGISKPS